jgi:hypothetical protein
MVMVWHSVGAAPTVPSLLTTHEDVFSLLPSDLSRHNPASSNSIVSAIEIYPLMSKTLVLVPFFAHS